MLRIFASQLVFHFGFIHLLHPDSILSLVGTSKVLIIFISAGFSASGLSYNGYKLTFVMATLSIIIVSSFFFPAKIIDLKNVAQVDQVFLVFPDLYSLYFSDIVPASFLFFFRGSASVFIY